MWGSLNYTAWTGIKEKSPPDGGDLSLVGRLGILLPRGGLNYFAPPLIRSPGSSNVPY